MANPINSLVTRNNELNDAIIALKSAVALATCALLVEARTGKDTDTLTYEILKADGKAPSQAEAAALAGRQAVCNADKAVAAALSKLVAGLEASSTRVAVTVAAGKLSASPNDPHVTSLIDSVEKDVATLRSALGAAHRVELKVRAATSPGEQVAKAEILGTTWESDDAEEPTKVPASCLDILKSKTADRILKAQSTLQAQLDAYTLISKGVAGHKLQVRPFGGRTAAAMAITQGTALVATVNSIYLLPRGP